MPPRKSTASKSRPRKRSTTAAKPIAPPRAGPGQRVFFLDVPFEERTVPRVFSATWHRGIGHVYVGKTLPQELHRYRPLAYSWEKWQEAQYAGEFSSAIPAPAPTADTGTFTLRPDQLEDVRKILIARKAGAPEFLVGSETGVGKTAVALAAVKRMARVKNVLVICPLTVAAGWRVHLDQMGDGGKNWCIVNYEATKKLLEPPPSAQTARSTRTRNLKTVRDGKPRVQWDVVIRDESQHCANPESQQTRAVNRIIAGPDTRAAFVLNLSATAATTPAKASYLMRGLCWREGRGVPQSVSMSMFLEWCETHGLSVDRSGFNDALKWTATGAAAQRELRRLNELIYGGDTPWALRRKPDWPEVQRFPIPVQLTAAELDAYNTDWAEFQDALRRIKRDEKTATGARGGAGAAAMRGAAAKMRFRQKAGQLRAHGVADFVAEKVSAGYQVSVSAEFIGTVDRIAKALTAKGVRTTTFTGENRQARDENRLAYQRGEYQVLIYTPTEGFNLHAGETAVGGNSVPRLTIIAEPRWSPDKTLQAEGRAQRNGTEAPVYYLYALGTVELDVLSVELNGMRNAAVINGDDTSSITAMIDSALTDYVTT